MGGPRNSEEVCASLEQDAQADPAPPFDLWPVIENATGNIIGHCGILDKMVDDQTEYELVYVFAALSWGKGYATEAATAIKRYAFERLGLERIVALIDPENAASERVAVKVNMRYERDTLRPSGKRCVYMQPTAIPAK
jgi:ribosomal-protein-alanine N-acetyltransferase